MHILNLIRWKNLIILIVSALLMRFALIPSFGVDIEFDLLSYALLVLSIVAIAAGGNIINDYYDVTTDSINKPNRLIIDKHISRRQALRIYLAVNCLGLGFAFYLFLMHPFDQIGLVFYIIILSPLVLATYSIWLKRLALIGNLLISLLVGLSLYSFGIVLFEHDNNPVLSFTITTYTFLAFMLNFCRELIKDQEDIKGDNFCKMKTLPILIGKKRTNYFIFGLLSLLIFSLLSVLLMYFMSLNVLVFYVSALIILPLILISRKILSAHKEKDYRTISFQLKLVFLSGIFSMFTFLTL